jgi:hypothetical protein
VSQRAVKESDGATRAPASRSMLAVTCFGGSTEKRPSPLAVSRKAVIEAVAASPDAAPASAEFMRSSVA